MASASGADRLWRGMDDNTDSRRIPTVRLKPKAEARAIRHGFPWVYADELVTDRRTQSLLPGALAVLEDGVVPLFTSIEKIFDIQTGKETQTEK